MVSEWFMPLPQENAVRGWDARRYNIRQVENLVCGLFMAPVSRICTIKLLFFRLRLQNPEISGDNINLGMRCLLCAPLTCRDNNPT